MQQLIQGSGDLALHQVKRIDAPGHGRKVIRRAGLDDAALGKLLEVPFRFLDRIGAGLDVRFQLLPKRRVALVERGVIRTPVVDKTYADRLGLAPTANGWSLGGADHGHALHIAVEGGDATREELIASTKSGIWVTRFNYVNGLLEPKTALMTGTTRDGTFLIRDGEIAARLPNLRWTQSMIEAISNIESLTKERRRVATWYNMFGGTIAPTVKINNWKFTGKS